MVNLREKMKGHKVSLLDSSEHQQAKEKMQERSRYTWYTWNRVKRRWRR